MEQINESPLHVKVYVVCFGSFIYREEQKVFQLRMVDGDAWTGLIKVQQVMENTLSMTDSPSEVHYTVQLSGVPLQCCLLAGGY